MDITSSVIMKNSHEHPFYSSDAIYIIYIIIYIIYIYIYDITSSVIMKDSHEQPFYSSDTIYIIYIIIYNIYIYIYIYNIYSLHNFTLSTRKVPCDIPTWFFGFPLFPSSMTMVLVNLVHLIFVLWSRRNGDEMEKSWKSKNKFSLL